MKALRFGNFGPPSVLSLENVPPPALGPDEVLVEVHASGINPSDVANVAGRFRAILPRIPGRDFAGVVVDGRSDIGKEVWGSGAGFGVTRDGAHAQFVAVPSAWLAEKPAHIPMARAAAVGIPYLAAWMGLVQAANIQEGETAFITGAAGAVGTAATQIAHWKKAKVIGADRAGRRAEADELINAEDGDLAQQARRLTGGKGVDLALDCVGGPMFEPSLKSLRVGGRMVVIAGQGDGRVEFNIMDFYHNNSRLLGVDTMKLKGEEIAAMMNEMRVGFEGGFLKPPEIEERSLEQAIEAYSATAGHQARKKQVLIFK